MPCRRSIQERFFASLTEVFAIDAIVFKKPSLLPSGVVLGYGNVYFFFFSNSICSIVVACFLVGSFS